MIATGRRQSKIQGYSTIASHPIIEPGGEWGSSCGCVYHPSSLNIPPMQSPTIDIKDTVYPSLFSPTPVFYDLDSELWNPNDSMDSPASPSQFGRTNKRKCESPDQFVIPVDMPGGSEQMIGLKRASPVETKVRFLFRLLWPALTKHSRQFRPVQPVLWLATCHRCYKAILL